MADVFELRDDLTEPRERLFRLIEATPHLTWQLLTKRPENVNRMLPHAWLANPLPNVWFGATVEDDQRARVRVPRLLRVPAAVRFLSCEPLLGDVDLSPWLDQGIGWVIAGGESGPRHRPLNLDHARRLRDDCADGSVPYFFKQVGGRTPTAGGDLLDGLTHKAFP